MGHFVSSPKEREKRDRRDSRGVKERETEKKENKNESEEIKTSPPLPLAATRIAGLAQL